MVYESIGSQEDRERWVRDLYAPIPGLRTPDRVSAQVQQDEMSAFMSFQREVR